MSVRIIGSAFTGEVNARDDATDGERMMVSVNAGVENSDTDPVSIDDPGREIAIIPDQRSAGGDFEMTCHVGISIEGNVLDAAFVRELANRISRYFYRSSFTVVQA